jgi:tetratricopeptide (TPR) repeat protein
MREFAGELSGAGRDESPLGQAQRILDDAFATDDPGTRVALAHKALGVSTDCADAYVLLAENAPSRKEALELYQKGVEAGQRTLGPERFEAGAGSFWGLIETRPFMRAKLGLADTLWTLGKRAEAVGHLEEMLRLNPNDNQGVRYTLAAWLLNLDRDEALARLLEQFPEEGSAAWAYTRALLAFRRQGDSPEARALLAQARKQNRHVPGFLLGQKPLPRQQPDHYGLGDTNEAVIYAGTSLSAWRDTPGALSWLRGREKERKSGRAPARKTTGPTAEVLRTLENLPQEFDVWQADSRQLTHWLLVKGEPIIPWVALVTSRSNDLVLAHTLGEDQPSSEAVWDTLAKAMRKPTVGAPHRPTTLQYQADGPLSDLVPHLETLGIACEPVDALDHVDFVFEGLVEHLGGSGPPGLLEMPGVDINRLAGFYQAAAGFYRRAPWRFLGYEQAIKVECDRFESGPWYAIIMGQSGLTTGVALYDDFEVIRRLWASTSSDEENARETVALTITFDMETEVPAPDLTAIRRHGWEVAGPEAYPSIFRKERGMTLRPPLAWELELMEGCLRALPRLIARFKPDDPTPHSITVPTAAGGLTLVLSWVGG